MLKVGVMIPIQVTESLSADFANRPFGTGRLAAGMPVVDRYGHFGGVACLVGSNNLLLAVCRREGKAVVFVKRDLRAVYGDSVHILFVNGDRLCFTVGLAVFYAADDRLNIIKCYTVGTKVCYIQPRVNKHCINNVFPVGVYAKRLLISAEYKRLKLRLGKILIGHQIGNKHGSAVVGGVYRHRLRILKEQAEGDFIQEFLPFVGAYDNFARGLFNVFPSRFERYIFGRHGRGNFRVPPREGVALSCRVGGGGNIRAVVLRYGNIRFAVFGFDCDGILIDLPLCPVFHIARSCTADCRNRRAGQIFVVIPALERVACIGHIVGCRECCAHAIGVSGDIAAVDGAAVGVQCDGIGRDCPLHCQCCHISRNAVTGNVEFTVASAPHKEIACISVRAGQVVGRRRGKVAAGFHDDLNILGAITQLAAAKVKGNDLQSARAQCVRVQDFKDGAETEVREGERSIVEVPVAGRIEPAKRTVRRISIVVLSKGILI